MVSFEGLMINNNFIYLSSSLCISFLSFYSKMNIKTMNIKRDQLF